LSREYALRRQFLIATTEDRNDERQHRICNQVQAAFAGSIFGF
jgi:hypothetical protein